MPSTMIQVEHAEFMLGDQRFTVPALGSKASKQWRGHFKENARLIFDLVSGQESLLESLNLQNISDISSVNIAEIIPALVAAFDTVNDTFDAAPELVRSYHSSISSDVVDNATNAQLLYALMEMARLDLANPFQKLFSRGNGRAANST